ncbi:hypothetical protein BBJ28_00021781 [Nothophytophthora sp. Chile5]|nr:hypothetical protein BBJ28_00021781 [Nothophytophthora sp. Chile5]
MRLTCALQSNRGSKRCIDGQLSAAHRLFLVTSRSLPTLPRRFIRTETTQQWTRKDRRFVPRRSRPLSCLNSPWDSLNPLLSRQIRVKFVTKDAAIRVTETPFAVPVSLSRRGLSQVVNHLLATGDKPRPFDFLVDGLFLRTSLEKYLLAHEVSEEALLVLEYVEALPEPQKQSESDHPDWVSAVATGATVSGDELIVTGCYDGVLRVYDVQGACLASVKAHQGAIKAVSVSADAEKSGEFVIASSGKDQLAQLWRYTAESTQLTPMAALTGHLNSVDAVKMHASGQRVVSGSWDNTVRVWQTPSSTDGGEQRSAKKHKKSEGSGAVSFQQLEAELVLVGHTSYVTGVAFRPTQSEHDEDVVVSAGSDRTVRLWDLTTQSCSQTLAGNRAVTDLSVNVAGLVLTAHPDHCVRLWDPRAQQSGESVVQRTFHSHKEWVSSVAWHPAHSSHEHLFVSGGYDGAAKVWDARSSVPLHTVNAHDGKLLALAWRRQSTQDNSDAVAFVSGGEDKQLNLFSV